MKTSSEKRERAHSTLSFVSCELMCCIRRKIKTQAFEYYYIQKKKQKMRKRKKR